MKDWLRAEFYSGSYKQDIQMQLEKWEVIDDTHVDFIIDAGIVLKGAHDGAMQNAGHPFYMAVGAFTGGGMAALGVGSEPGLGIAKEESLIRYEEILSDMGDTEFIMLDRDRREQMISELQSTIEMYTNRNDNMMDYLEQMGDNDQLAVDKGDIMMIYHRDDLENRIYEYNTGIDFARKVIWINQNIPSDLIR